MQTATLLHVAALKGPSAGIQIHFVSGANNIVSRCKYQIKEQRSKRHMADVELHCSNENTFVLTYLYSASVCFYVKEKLSPVN
jgi:hypothetical protein